MEIRKANYDDYTEILKLCKQIHEQHVEYRPDVFKKVVIPMAKDTFNELLKSESLFVIAVNQRVIGYTSIFIKETNNFILCKRKILFIDTIVINKDYQHLEYGKKLLDFIKELAKNKFCDSIELQVSKENQIAINFYKSNMFDVKEYKMEYKI